MHFVLRLFFCISSICIICRIDVSEIFLVIVVKTVRETMDVVMMWARGALCLQGLSRGRLLLWSCLFCCRGKAYGCARMLVELKRRYACMFTLDTKYLLHITCICFLRHFSRNRRVNATIEYRSDHGYEQLSCRVRCYVVAFCMDSVENDNAAQTVATSLTGHPHVVSAEESLLSDRDGA